MSKKKRKSPRAHDHEKTFASSASDKLAAKKAAVLGSEKKKLPIVSIAIVLCAALVAGSVIAYALKQRTEPTQVASSSSSSSSKTVPQTTETDAQAAPETTLLAATTESVSDAVSYPETMFMDGIAKFFEHKDGDITIKYFIIKSIDGVIRAAFDACDVCWPAGKGYVQDGDYMICQNCGRRFDSTSINEVNGGCNPAPLERTMKDGAVFIKLEKILEGQGYFDYSQHT